MKMSRLFGRTLRHAPADVESDSAAMLIRAGFMRRLGVGSYFSLPLGRRTMARIETLLKQELEAAGAQEVRLPPGHALVDGLAMPLQDSTEPMVLPADNGPERESKRPWDELWWALVRHEIQSHRQLPAMLYQVRPMWRQDARSKGDLMRMRECTMGTCISLDKDEGGLDERRLTLIHACRDACQRCGLPVTELSSDWSGSGDSVQALAYVTPVGRDRILSCGSCGYQAERMTAGFRRPKPPEEPARPLEKVATAGVTSIDALADFLAVSPAQTAKAVFLVAEVTEGGQVRERFIFALVRGDMAVSETKLACLLGARTLRPAREEEIRAAGAQPGYASPIGVEGALVVVDELIPRCANLVAGANEEGFHLRNVNYGRDFLADMVGDIALADEGSACPRCGEPLGELRGVLVTETRGMETPGGQVPGASYLDEAGRSRPVFVNSFGIDLERLMACLVEEHHDERGLVWPITVAPYQVHLIDLSKNGIVARDMWEALQRAGLEVLFDDRDERAGVKFEDADLIGLPVRVTVGERGLNQGVVELELRRERGSMKLVSVDDVVAQVQERISALEAELFEKKQFGTAVESFVEE